jgi:hypothetical protein
MRLTPRFAYPKLLALACSFAAAYVLARMGLLHSVAEWFNGDGYVSVFIGGMLYTFGFTAGFGFALLAEVSQHVHPIPAALLGGAGATIADMTLFRFVRISLKDEWTLLLQSATALRIRTLLHRHVRFEYLRRAGIWLLACTIIASPLPDEIGITVLGGG